ncbi:MAG TPA: cob(I)yrinic acid a,c-diamide adenosyltransferase [Candidatus Dormibacteraeota bacterium]|nr:cob(I)yrinic acid a,c-diamide adenosyltransferase [Candidatus Dormibacteraeota bacterium]
MKDFKHKESVTLVYTGEGKGKTSASLGLMARALGNGWSVAFIQFIKYWEVSEHHFIKDISPLYGDKLFFYKGGKGFYNAGELSQKDVSDKQHKEAAKTTYQKALECAKNGQYDLVICDEINNAVSDGLLSKNDLKNLILLKSAKTSLCLTGRNFPTDYLEYVDIATNMDKIKHHYDQKYIANKGIDY